MAENGNSSEMQFRMEVHPIISKMGTTRDDTYLLLRKSRTLPGIIEEMEELAKRSNYEEIITCIEPDEYTTPRIILTNEMAKNHGLEEGPLDSFIYEDGKSIGYTSAIHSRVIFGREISSGPNMDRLIHDAALKLLTEILGHQFHDAIWNQDMTFLPAGNGKWTIAFYVFVSLKAFLDNRKEVEEKALAMGYEWVVARDIIMNEVIVDGSTTGSQDCIAMILRRAVH